jgi:hypothetical protein
VAGEGRKEEVSSQRVRMMKVDQFAYYSEKPVHHRLRILEAGLSLTDVRKAHLAVAFSLHLKSRVFVKAAGKPHVQFGRRTEASAQARLLRPDCV